MPVRSPERLTVRPSTLCYAYCRWRWSCPSRSLSMIPSPVPSMATDRFHITVALLQRDGRDLSRHLPFVAFRSSQIGYGVLGLVLQAENLTWMGRESETAGLLQRRKQYFDPGSTQPCLGLSCSISTTINVLTSRSRRLVSDLKMISPPLQL